MSLSSESEPLYQSIPDDPLLSGEARDCLDASQVDAPTSWTFFTLGCALLLPWNVIITALPFFLSRLEESPHLKHTFTSYLTTTCNVVGFVSLAHATFFRTKSPSPSRETRRMILALVALTFMLLLSAKTRVSPGFFAAFVLLNGAAQSVCSAYLQNAVFAVGSLFGSVALQSILSGQAAAAVAVSAVQVFSAATTLWGLPRTSSIATYVSDGSVEERSAFIFFASSVVFLLVCALVHTWLVRMPIYRKVAGPLEKDLHTAQEHRRLIAGGEIKALRDQSQIVRVAKDNLIYQLAVAYIFIVTLCVFPPITTSISPINPDIHPLLFVSIHFFVYNGGDFLGRYLCSFPRLQLWSAKRLLLFSSLRTLFVPLFLMCNVQEPNSSAITRPIIRSDFLYMFILFIFGITNGHLGSMCIISASSLEHNPRLRGRKGDVDIVATVTNFSLIGGLLIGSAASFGVKAAICNCNPFTG